MEPRDKIHALLNKGRFAAAQTLCEKQCKQHPRNPNVWLMLASVHAQLENYAGVVACCDKVLAINPSDTIAQYNKGVALQSLGDMTGAADAFLKTLQFQPENVQALVNLSLVSRTLGEYEEAILYANKSIRIDSSNPGAYNSLGLALKDAGRLDQAVEAFLTAIKLSPKMFQAHYNLGLVHFLAGENTRSIKCLHKAIKIKPDYFEAYNDLGNAFKCEGELDKALAAYNKALTINATSASAQNNLGLLLIELSETDKALACFKKALKLFPDHPEINNNLGSLLCQFDQACEALYYLNRAVQVKPDYIEAYCNLGLALLKQNCAAEARGNFIQAIKANDVCAQAYVGYANACYALGEYRESIAAYKKSIGLEPGNAEVYISLAEALLRLEPSKDNHLQAEKALRNALTINANDIRSLCFLGNTLHLLGRYEEAIEVFRQGLEIDATHLECIAGAVRAMERIGDFSAAEALLCPLLESGEITNINLAVAFSTLAPHIGMQEKAIKGLEHVIATTSDKENLATACFALGKLYDSQKNYPKAFVYFDRANTSGDIKHDKKKCRNEFKACMDAYTPDKIISRIRASNASKMPIFIVGMPRSGTSLVEQILASHPDVYGAGELEDIGLLSVELTRRLGSTSLYPEPIDRMTQECADNIAQMHLEKLAIYADNAPHVIDKMPHNFMQLGLIDILFPGSRIVHCTRNPMDTCLSIYFQSFNDHHPYANSLEDLGSYYREYERLMAHWHSVLRIPILDIQYENLVENTSDLTHELLDFCELEWADQCLRFYDSNRQVKTPSYDQVRRPIYKNSVSRWKNYESDLAPLVNALSND